MSVSKKSLITTHLTLSILVALPIPMELLAEANLDSCEV